MKIVDKIKLKLEEAIFETDCIRDEIVFKAELTDDEEKYLNSSEELEIFLAKAIIKYANQILMLFNKK